MTFDNLLSQHDLLPDVEVVDVGASNVSAAERPAYDPLIGAGLGRLTGFEPNPAEFGKLEQTPARRYLPYAIGDGAVATLNVTRKPGFSSTLHPNVDIASRISNFARAMRVVNTHEFQTRRLDDIDAIERMDWLKIDIQGGECAAFDGSKQLLSKCLCVHTEVCFLELYQGQKGFDEQHKRLSSAGLMFLGFYQVNRHPLAADLNALSRHLRRRDIGAWVDADALYVRDVRQWEGMDDIALTKLLAILLSAYDAFSAAVRIAEILDGRKVTEGLAPNLIAWFNTKT